MSATNWLSSIQCEWRGTLDRGLGECWLKDPRVARLVVTALRYFDKKRYNLDAWCVMPNHVHVVVRPIAPSDSALYLLGSIVHSWKSYTAKQANKILRRSGEFWQREYYDHLIRDEEEFWHFIEYTLENPVKAGLCRRWEEWPWSGLP